MVTKHSPKWVITTVRTITAETSIEALAQYGQNPAKVDSLTVKEAKEAK